MSAERIRARVEQLCLEYRAAFGCDFAHFLCPILRTDEPGPLCEGHVIPQAFGTCDAWVPQRRDVDNFYGTMTEEDFINVVRHRLKDPFEKWLDPSARRAFRPKMVFGDKQLDNYFPKTPAQVPGHTFGKLIINDEPVCDLVIKESSEFMKSISGQEVRIVIDQDLRPAVIASLLKAAHLTLFSLLGYRHVFSAAGMLLSDILGGFYLSNAEKDKKELQQALAADFVPHARMISPMLIRDKSVLNGTILDNRILGCFGGKEGMFAIGVIVPAGNDRFCVFLPSGQGQTIDTYLGFLNDPPSSIAAKLVEFVPAKDGGESYWAVSKDDPIRIPMPDKLPEL